MIIYFLSILLFVIDFESNSEKFYGILCFHKWNIYDCMNEFKCMNFRYSVLKIVTAHNAQTSINLNIDEYIRIVIISFFPARD